MWGWLGEEETSHWQAAYDEKLLSPDGESVLRDLWGGDDDDELWVGTVRLAFFMNYLDLARPLATPFGEATLPSPEPRPVRLRSIDYEEP